MSRSTSANFRKAVYDENSGEVIVCLLTITHDDLPSPKYISSDATVRLSTEPLEYGTVSRGNNYTWIPFEIKLPSENDEEQPTIQINLDNLGQELITLLRSTTTPAVVDIELCLASSPNTIEASFPGFDLVSATYDVGTVVLTLALDSLNTEPYPSGTFNPTYFGGLF